MKYPYVAAALFILWTGTTLMIIKNNAVDVTYFILVAFIGTIIISAIGFRPPKISR